LENSVTVILISVVNEKNKKKYDYSESIIVLSSIEKYNAIGELKRRHVHKKGRI